MGSSIAVRTTADRAAAKLFPRPGRRGQYSECAAPLFAVAEARSAATAYRLGRWDI